MLPLETGGILPSGVMESLAGKVNNDMHLCGSNFKLYLPSITFAARLAHQGLLGSVKRMKLAHDLTSVPDYQLASLVSSLQCGETGPVSSLKIQNVCGCDLVTVLDSVKNPIWELTIRTQSLGSEETQALVRALESSVEEFVLGVGVTGCRVFQ